MATTPLDRLLEYNMHLLKHSGHPRHFADWRQDLVTAAVSAWFFGGLILDAWARATDRHEPFFTWWHLIFCTGYLAVAAWIVHLLVRAHRADGRTGLAAVPHGYGPAVVGIPLFLFSALADLVWHGLFGTESALGVLFSPPHLGLAVSGVLIVAAPWLSAWRRDALGVEPEAAHESLRFLAPALSLGHVGSAVVLLLSYGIAFTWSPAEVVTGLSEPYGPVGAAVAAGLMLTTLAVLGLVVIATGRFRLPPGCFTVAFLFPALAAGANAGFENLGFAVLFLASGALADFLAWLVRPDLRRRKDLITFAVAWSIPTWLAYMIMASAAEGAWPSIAIVTGAPLAAALLGTVFMLVIQPDHREAPPVRPAEPSPFDDVIARAKAMTEGRGDQS